MQKNIPGLLLLLTLLCGCVSKNRRDERTTEKQELHQRPTKYAKGFSISEGQNFFLLQLYSPFRDRKDTLNYIIGQPADGSFTTGFQLLSTPIRSTVLLASPHSAFLDRLDKMGVIKGISTRNYFYNRRIQEGVENGRIAEVGFGQNLNTEKLIMMAPDILIFSGMSSSDEVRYSTLANAGIVLFPAAEWQENHPLGRAEWIKVFGLLFGEYESSVDIFNEIEENYLSLKENEAQGSRPTVIVNAPYKDVWWLPGGNSYVSKLIADAKGSYVWSRNGEEGGMQIDIETIFNEAHDADYWINPGQFRTKDELLAQDGRYKEFSAFQNDRVYNNDLRLNKYGGNDYYESGLVRPDLVLSDMIKIFHPETLPGYEFYFYRKVP